MLVRCSDFGLDTSIKYVWRRAWQPWTAHCGLERWCFGRPTHSTPWLELVRNLVPIGQSVNPEGARPEQTQDAFPRTFKHLYASVSLGGPNHSWVVFDKLTELVAGRPTDQIE